MKRLVLNIFLTLLMLGGISAAQEVTGGSGSGLPPGCTSPGAGQLTCTGAVIGASFAGTGSNQYIDSTNASAVPNPTGVVNRFFSLDGIGWGDLDSNGCSRVFGFTPPRTVAGTTDAIVACDRGRIVEYTNAGAIAVTIPDANTTTSSNFYTGSCFDLFNSGTGTVTVSRTTASTINGGTTLIVYPGNSVHICSTGANWQAPGVDPSQVVAGSVVKTLGTTAGGIVATQGPANGHATANTVTIEAPAAVTAYEILLPAAAATGLAHYANSSSVVTETISAVTSADATGNTSGSGNFCLVTSCTMVTPVLGAATGTSLNLGATGVLSTTATSGSGSLAMTTSPVLTTPNVTVIKDANANPFIQSSATASAVDGITVTTAATANPATVTIAPSGSDANINLGLNAKGSGIIQPATFVNATSHVAALTADWTCGTGGTVSSCTSATIIGSGGGVPLTFTLPLQSLAWTLECDLVVGQATAATANSWNFLTATNGATNVTASYQMNTAATAMTGGATTDQASTTTTVVIGSTWTLGGTATKMPAHVWARVEGASASGTVLSLQLVAPTVGDLVTIYRGSSCRLR